MNTSRCYKCNRKESQRLLFFLLICITMKRNNLKTFYYSLFLRVPAKSWCSSKTFVEVIFTLWFIYILTLYD